MTLPRDDYPTAADEAEWDAAWDAELDRRQEEWVAAQRAAEQQACEHLSATGVDQTDGRDPAKVWRCDGCGWTYRYEEIVADPPTAFPFDRMVAVGPCERCDGRGEIVCGCCHGRSTTAPGDSCDACGGGAHDQCPDCSSTGWAVTSGGPPAR